MSAVFVLYLYVCLCVSVFRYGLSWNVLLNGHLLSASDDHVMTVYIATYIVTAVLINLEQEVICYMPI